MGIFSGKMVRDTYRELDSFTLLYTANYNVTVAATYPYWDSMTLKWDTNKELDSLLDNYIQFFLMNRIDSFYSAPS